MSVAFTRRSGYAILIMHHKDFFFKIEKQHRLIILNKIYNNHLQIRYRLCIMIQLLIYKKYFDNQNFYNINFNDTKESGSGLKASCYL